MSCTDKSFQTWSCLQEENEEDAVSSTQEKEMKPQQPQQNIETKHQVIKYSVKIIYSLIWQWHSL